MLVNIENIKPKFLFVGKELEGPLFGTSTLFVSDDVPVDLVLDPYKNASPDLFPSYDHVYFGANHLSRINLSTVCEVFEKTELVYITLEISDWEAFLSVLAEQDQEVQNRLKKVLVSSRVFLMCCIYKGPQKNTLHSNTKILDAPHTDSILKGKTLCNLLVKVETNRGVYVSAVSTYSETSWDAYSGDVVIWEETVNSSIKQ